MKKGEFFFGLGLFLFGAFTLEESLKLPYFVEEVPGPGFLPVWLALVVIVCGVVLTWRGFRPQGLGRDEGWPDPAGWVRIAAVIVGLLATLLLLEPLGFVVTTVLYIGVVSAVLGVRSWKLLVPVPLLCAAVLYGVFGFWLHVPLPQGIPGFPG